MKRMKDRGRREKERKIWRQIKRERGGERENKNNSEKEIYREREREVGKEGDKVERLHSHGSQK